MELNYSITNQFINIGKVRGFYKSYLHGEHKCNNHEKYNSFQMIFLQL